MYTQTSGCNIVTPEESATWEVLCVQYPNAAPFRNCGWEIYEDIKRLCPNKAKGTHSFYPSTGTQGMRDPTSTGLEEPSTFSPPEWDDSEAAFGATSGLIPPVEETPCDGTEPQQNEVCCDYCCPFHNDST
jgi:hypothetical protein